MSNSTRTRNKPAIHSDTCDICRAWNRYLRTNPEYIYTIEASLQPDRQVIMKFKYDYDYWPADGGPRPAGGGYSNIDRLHEGLGHWAEGDGQNLDYWIAVERRSHHKL